MRPHPMPNPFRCFTSSPAAVRLPVMTCIRFPVALRRKDSGQDERWVRLRDLMDLQGSATVRAAVYRLFTLQRCAAAPTVWRRPAA